METKRHLLKEQIKKISIRGRMVIGIICLENVFKYNEIYDDPLKELLGKLKEFTCSNSLDVWDKQINEYDPVTILDDHPGNNFDEYQFLNKEELLNLKDIYLNIPRQVLNCISYAIEIGTSNLYGGTEKYSPLSLEPTLKIIELSGHENSIKTIINDLIQKTPFEDKNGWGKVFNSNETTNKFHSSN